MVLHIQLFENSLIEQVGGCRCAVCVLDHRFEAGEKVRSPGIACFIHVRIGKYVIEEYLLGNFTCPGCIRSRLVCQIDVFQNEITCQDFQISLGHIGYQKTHGRPLTFRGIADGFYQFRHVVSRKLKVLQRYPPRIPGEYPPATQLAFYF